MGVKTGWRRSSELRSRQQLLNQIKKQVHQLVGDDTPDLRAYGDAYKREFLGRWVTSDWDQLLEKILESRLVLGGDFHAFSQAQRTHLRLLRNIPEDVPVILGLECFESRHQDDLDAYCAGQLGETAFLERIDWRRHWGFPWENYKPLVDLARERFYPVVGLNRFFRRRSLTTLGRRDEHAAAVIKGILKKYPHHLVYVVFGDLHLAANHLPQFVEGLMGPEDTILRVFQNSESLYFRLVQRGQEHQIDVLRRGHQTYCVLSSPPWVKWQSYLIWLEQNFDHDLDDGESTQDFTDYISGLVRFLAAELKVKVGTADLAAYSLEDPKMYLVIRQAVAPALRRQAIELMKNERSFLIPEKGIVYLSRATINHAATLAGQYLHMKLRGSRHLAWRMPQDFLEQIWIEAVGFFFSKIINHKRKAESLRDLKNRLAAIDSAGKGYEVLALALDQRLREVIWVQTGRMRPLRRRPRQAGRYFEAARLLGHMLGDRLFLAYQEGHIDREHLLGLLRHSSQGPREFRAFYYEVLRRLEVRR